MRIMAAPVMQVMPVPKVGEAGGSMDFGAMLAEAGGEAGTGDVVSGDVAAEDAVVVDAAVAVPVMPVLPVLPVLPVVPVMPALPVPAVMQILPPPAGGRTGEGGDGLVLASSTRDSAVLPEVPVPTVVADFDLVAASRSPSPRPSPRGGEGVFVAPVRDGAPVSDVAPAGAMLRDVSALLAAQPGVVTMVSTAAPVVPGVVSAVVPPLAMPGVAAGAPVARAMPAVGVAEAAIREQVAALVAGGDGPERDDDVADIAQGDPVPTAGAPVAILSPAAGAGPALPVLSADGALGLHVAAARAGQELDGIARDIAATNGSGDGAMRFRLDPVALGPVMVEVARGLDGMAVRIEARDGSARDLIADQQPRLVTDARAAGVQIATVQVEARRDDPATSASSYQQATGQQPQSSSGQSGQRPQPQVPTPTAGWTRPGARVADTGPRAASELYA